MRGWLQTAMAPMTGRAPVPATFVIDQNQRIVLAYIDVDYRNRLEPESAIAVLPSFTRQNAA